jgi:hypothetical protein
MRRENRELLRSADDKTRTEMLKSFEFREAALSPGATAYNSGLSETKFQSYREARIAERFPVEIQMQQDFNKKRDALSNHLRALAAQNETERRALGVAPPGAKPKPTPEPWE